VTPSWYRYNVSRWLEIEGGIELRSRAEALRRCGNKVSVRRCTCGHEPEGSGEFGLVSRTCDARVCPSCAWKRARETEEWMVDVAKELPEEEGWRWQFFVLTSKYDPSNEEEVTAEALRSRARGMGRAVQAIWKEVLKVDGAGLFRTIECGKSGMVHANLLYYGPMVDHWDITRVGQRTFSRCGHVYGRPVDGGGQDAINLPERISAVARYMAKSIDGSRFAFNEDWLAGSWIVRTMDPHLAARWEIACFKKVRVSEKYGSFRGVKRRPLEKIVEEDNSEKVCPCCGQKGKWHYVLKWTQEWLLACHDKGKAGMRRSSWKPRWLRDRDPPGG